jgi:hypothetical protein
MSNTLKIISPDKSIVSENFEVDFDLENNESDLEITIIDKYPDIKDGIAIERRFFFKDRNDAGHLKGLGAKYIGHNFIDRKNQSGKRMIIYHYDISGDEFYEQNNLLLISTDYEGKNLICDPFQIKNLLVNTTEKMPATKDDIQKLTWAIEALEKKLQTNIDSKVAVSDFDLLGFEVGGLNKMFTHWRNFFEAIYTSLIDQEKAFPNLLTNVIYSTHEEDFQNHTKNVFKAAQNFLETLKKPSADSSTFGFIKQEIATMTKKEEQSN